MLIVFVGWVWGGGGVGFPFPPSHGSAIWDVGYRVNDGVLDTSDRVSVMTSFVDPGSGAF